MQLQLKCEHRHWGKKYIFFWVLGQYVRFVFSSVIVELYKWTRQIEEFWRPADTRKPYTGDSLSRDCQTAHHSQSRQLEEMSKNRGTKIFLKFQTKNSIMINGNCANAYHHLDFIKMEIWYHNNIVKYLWYIILRDSGLLGYLFLHVRLHQRIWWRCNYDYSCIFYVPG